MSTVNAAQARKQLYALIDTVAESHTPVEIIGKKNNAVLIADADWRAICETLALTNIPGMRDSIREGLATPLNNCDTTLPW